MTTIMEFSKAGQELFEFIKCPVCDHHPTSTVFSCVNGHYVCEPCKQSLNGKCPICRIDINHDEAISRLLRNATYRTPCRFQEAGCKNLVIPVEMIDHMKECLHRPVICGMSSVCLIDNNVKSALAIRKHWQETHGIWTGDGRNQYPSEDLVVVEGERFELVCKTSPFPCDESMYKYFKFGDGEYLLIVGNFEEGLIHFWIINLANQTWTVEDENVTYSADVASVINNNSSAVKISWDQLHVMGIRVHYLDAAQDFGKYATLHRGLLTASTKINSDNLQTEFTVGITMHSNK